MNSKIFNFFAVVLLGYSLFISGHSFADNRTAAGILNLILAALWLSILVAEWFVREKKIQLLEKLERSSDNIFKTLGKVFDDVDAERKRDQHIANTLEKITHEIVKGKKPQKAHISKIEKAFHQKMPGHWLKLELNKNGKFDAEVSNQPFTKKPVTKKKGSK